MTFASKVISPLLVFLGAMTPSPPKEVLSLSISPTMQTVKTGSQVRVEAKLTNVANDPVSFSDTIPDCDLTVTITDAKGESPPETSYKRGLKCGGRLTASRNILVTLKPGESRKEEIVITRLYQLERPGSYFVQAQRQPPTDPSASYVKSNTVTVTVTE